MDACLLLPILLITTVMGSTLEQEEMEVEEVVQENFISSRDFKVKSHDQHNNSHEIAFRE